MAELIKFIATDKFLFDLAPRPYPAKDSLPSWWREQTPYAKSVDNPDGKKLIVRDFESNATFKKCTPMLDALTSGYIIPLFADVLISNIGEDEYIPELNWRVKVQMFELHASESVKISKPSGYVPRAFKYINPWNIVTPPGYSILVTAPMGYLDSTFRPISAVLDTDKSPHPLVLPLWLKEGFEGVVERGTPIAQIIPFKRNNWESEFDYYDDNYKSTFFREIKATIVNNYVKNHWSKKSYK